MGVVLIPAYCPSAALLPLISELQGSHPDGIVIVDDGSNRKSADARWR